MMREKITTLTKKVITILLAAGLICGLMTGCGNDTKEPVQLDEPYNVSLVTAIANNNPVLDTSIDEISQIANVAGTSYSAILPDSTPSVICDGTVPDFSKKGYSNEMIQRARSGVAADIISKLDEAAPDSDDVDIAAATSLAVRKLHSKATDGRENILVFYGSGISTSGLINFTTVPVAELDVDSSVETIAGQMNLDMSDIKVIWYCCGDTAGNEQEPLSDNEKNILKEFYEKLFTKLGASEVTFMDDTPIDGAYDFDQEVAVMQTEETDSGLQAKVIDYEEAEKKEEIVEKTFAEGDILSFDAKSIAFQPDSTELVDKNAALDALEYVISYMKCYPEFKVMICGTTASVGDEPSCISFSEKRAETIKDLMTEAGISEERIVVLGCGWSSCLYIDDRGSDGELDEHAPENRSVKLVDYSSDTAKDIMDSLTA